MVMEMDFRIKLVWFVFVFWYLSFIICNIRIMMVFVFLFFWESDDWFCVGDVSCMYGIFLSSLYIFFLLLFEFCKWRGRELKIFFWIFNSFYYFWCISLLMMVDIEFFLLFIFFVIYIFYFIYICKSF